MTTRFYACTLEMRFDNHVAVRWDGMCGSREGYCSEKVKGKREKLMEKKTESAATLESAP